MGRQVFTHEWLFGSDHVKYKPTTRVSYSWLRRYQQHPVTPSNTQNSALAANDIHHLHNETDCGHCQRYSHGTVGQRFSAQFSLNLPMSELLFHVLVLFLLLFMENYLSLEVSFSLWIHHISSFLRFPTPKLHTRSHVAILHTLTTPTNQGAFNSHGSRPTTTHLDLGKKSFTARNGSKRTAHPCKGGEKWCTWLQSRAFLGQAQNGHAVCTLQVHPATSPCPFPKGVAKCDITR